MQQTFRDASGAEIPCTLFVPGGEKTDAKRPVVLFLNGFGENGNNGLAQISENLGLPIWEMKRRFPFIVVAPQCPDDETWNPGRANAAKALTVVDEVIAPYGGDPDRVYLTGPSSGGNGVLQVAAAYPARFAAIAPLCSDKGTGDVKHWRWP